MTLAAPPPEALPGLLWQLADSAFPGGGFAHSLGLEAAWQQGEVRNQAEFTGYLEMNLRQAGHSAVPFLTAVYDEPNSLTEVDRRADIWLINPVANRASRAQGRALHSSAPRIFRVSLKVTPFRHFSPVLGALLKSLAIPRLDSVRLLLFWHLRGLLSASIRLGIVGPLEAQSIQFDRQALLEEVALSCSRLSLGDVSQLAPLHEIWQANHDRLTSRLFQS